MPPAPRAAFVLLAVVTVFAAVVLATARPGDPDLFPPRAGAQQVVVFVSHNRHHAELALPTDWVRGHGGATAEALARLPPSPWILVGWGDARFYRETGWSAERFRDGLRALWPDNPSVLRITRLSRAPDLAFESGVARIVLSEPGAERMLRRLDSSFGRAGSRPRLVTPVQPDAEEIYFESVERFSITKSCNAWVGELMNAAGIPTRPALHLPPQGLVWDIRAARSNEPTSPA